MVGDVVGQWDISILDVWRQTAELEPSEESLSTKERERGRKKERFNFKKKAFLGRFNCSTCTNAAPLTCKDKIGIVSGVIIFP